MYRKITMAYYYLCVITYYTLPRRHRTTYCSKRIFAGTPNETHRRCSCRWAGAGIHENFDPIVSGDPTSDSGVQVSEISERSDTARTVYCVLYTYIILLLYPVLNIMLSQWRITLICANNIIIILETISVSDRLIAGLRERISTQCDSCKTSYIYYIYYT